MFESVSSRRVHLCGRQIRGVDHLALWVNDAEDTAAHLCRRFGFRPVAERQGEACGVIRRVVRQGDIRLVLTSTRDTSSRIHEHVQQHGEGVRDVAFRVDDVEAAYRAALSLGATGVVAPVSEERARGVVRHATIAGFGDNTLHSLVERSGYAGAHAPSYQECAPAEPACLLPLPALLEIDHLNTALPIGAMDAWVAFYVDILGFSEVQRFDPTRLSTEESAVNSRVIQDPSGKLLLACAEPIAGRPGHIDRGLAAHGGPYVQHVAMTCASLVESVRALRARGVGFMAVPPTYYRELAKRVHADGLDVSALAELAILVDQDEAGTLLQIFTEHVGNESWFELIERRGSRHCLGEGNIKALALAAERHRHAARPADDVVQA